jgi:hypothetical protein
MTSPTRWLALAALLLSTSSVSALDCPRSDIRVWAALDEDGPFKDVTLDFGDSDQDGIPDTAIVDRTQPQSVTVRAYLLNSYRYWWIAQNSLCEPDIDTIRFQPVVGLESDTLSNGTPGILSELTVGAALDGTKTRVTVGRPSLIWLEDLDEASNRQILADQLGCRHLNSFIYERPDLPERPQLPEVDEKGNPIIYDTNGDGVPDGPNNIDPNPVLRPFDYVVNSPTYGQTRRNVEFAHVLVRIGISGDMGNLTAGQIVRLQADRIGKHLLGGSELQGRTTIPAGFPGCDDNPSRCDSGDPVNSTADTAVFNIYGPVGVITANQMGDSSNLLANQANQAAWECYVYGLYFDRRKPFAQRRYEVEQVTTQQRQSLGPNDPPRSGNIESKRFNVNFGSVNIISADGRVMLEPLLVENGQVQFMIGDRGIGAGYNGSTRVGAAGMEANVGFGGVDIVAGEYDDVTDAALRTADITGTFEYFTRKQQFVPPDLDDPFFTRGGSLSMVRVARVPGEEGGRLNGKIEFHDIQDSPNGPRPIDRVRIDGAHEQGSLVMTSRTAQNAGGQQEVNRYGTLAANRAVWIGGLASPQGATAGIVVNDTLLEAGGLPASPQIKGQIIINRNAEFTIGPSNPPFVFETVQDMIESYDVETASAFGGVPANYQALYTETSAQVGGGAIGVVPFHLHRNDCVPSNPQYIFNPNATEKPLYPFALGVTLPPQPPAPAPGSGTPWSASEWSGLLISRSQLHSSAPDHQEARLRFYGPIVAAPGATRLMTVQHSTEPDFAPGTVQDLTHQFSLVIEGPQAPGFVRDLRPRLQCGQLPAGYYRIIRNAGDAESPPGIAHGLLCGQVQGLTPIGSTAYYFRLPGCNPSDVAGQGQTIGGDFVLGADDIIVFINWWFAQDWRADIAGAGQTIGPDGAFTPDDQIAFINTFFLGCLDSENGQPECFMAGGNQPESMSAPGTPNNGAAPSNQPAGLTAERLAQFDALIAAETDPARRAALQAARAVMLQGQAPAGASDDR